MPLVVNGELGVDFPAPSKPGTVPVSWLMARPINVSTGVASSVCGWHAGVVVGVNAAMVRAQTRWFSSVLCVPSAVSEVAIAEVRLASGVPSC